MQIGELAHTRMGPSIFYELAGGSEDPAVPWNRLEQVMAHLGTPTLTHDSPREWGEHE